MTRDETKRIIQKILIYRPFLRDKISTEQQLIDFVDEWQRILKNYDFKDVDENLDDFLKRESTKNPDPFLLTKNIKTIEQKNIKNKIFIYCEVCKKPLEIYMNAEKIDRDNADEHMSRCRSIRYLRNVYRNCFDREIDEETEHDLKKMSRTKFSEVYYLILEKALNKTTVDVSKKFLKKVLETRVNE